MKSKTLISVVVIGLVLIGLTTWSRQGSTSENNRNDSLIKLTALETAFDFDSIRINGGLVKHDFLIKNDGGQPITIKKIYTSCMCTTATWTGSGGTVGPFGMPGHGALPTVSETLRPGGEATVTVAFDPAAHGPSGLGRVERLIYIESEEAQALILKIYAQVTP